MSGSCEADLPIELPELSATGQYRVGFSGGLDSTVLLHWLSRHADSKVSAVHVNHGLHADAHAWSVHCRDVAQKLGIPIDVISVDVDSQGGSGLEAAARTARYVGIKALLQAEDVLLTAHHQDDQVETLLLQLLRGAGPHGLAGMPSEAMFGAGRHVRPLLNISRIAIEEYAKQHELTWIEDPSNVDEHHRRNYLRHRVTPVIEECWPQYRSCLARSAMLQAETAGLLDDLAHTDMLACAGSYESGLSIMRLRELSAQRRRNVIRFWIRQSGFQLPSQAHMKRIESDMLAAREDANPVVSWSDVELHRYRDDLLAMHRLPAPPGSNSLHWDMVNPIELPEGCGWLEAECAQGAGLRLETTRLELRFNQPGERIQPVFSKHHKRLKQLFQEKAVPPWVRERLPLIYHGQNLAAVADCWIAAEYAARQNEQGWLIHWRDAPVGWAGPELLLKS